MKQKTQSLVWKYSSPICTKLVKIQMIISNSSNSYNNASMSKSNRSSNKKNALERLRRVSIVSERQITERMECR